MNNPSVPVAFSLGYGGPAGGIMRKLAIDQTAAICLGAYGLAWAGAVALLATKPGGQWMDAVMSLVVFAVVLPGLGWLLTLRARSPAIAIGRPGFELSLILVYLGLYAVLFLGIGLNAVHAALRPGRELDVLLVVFKLVVHVALPATLLAVIGAQIRPLFSAGVSRGGFWPSLLVLGPLLLALLCEISPSLDDIAATKASVVTLLWATPACFLWLAIEAGLCEEFLFRAVLQSRLAAVLKSEFGAVFIGALIFAAAHAPGLWMRADASVQGHASNLLQAAAYAVAVLSPAGVFLGVMWSRTRSLLLVVLLHACVDVLPAMAEFIRTWR